MSDEQSDSEPKPIIIDLTGSQGVRTQFLSVTEFRDWVAGELQAWAWLVDLLTPADPKNAVAIPAELASTLGQTKSRLTDRFKNAADTLREKQDGQEVDAAVLKRARGIETEASIGNLILRDSARFNYIESIRREDAVRAAVVATIFCGVPLPRTGFVIQMQGELDATLWLTKRSTEFPQAANIELDSLRTRWARQIEQATRATQQTEEALVAVQKDGTTLRERWKRFEEATLQDMQEKVVETRKSVADEVQQLREQYKTDIEALRKDFSDWVGLKEPVKTWTAAHTEHKIGAKSALKWAIIGAIVGAGLLVGWGFWMQSHLQGRIVNFADYWLLGPSALLLFLYVWYLRVCVRYFMAKSHQASEAHHRMVLTTAYLSLLSGSHVSTSEASTRTVFDAIFRPVDSGLGSGDTTPQAPSTVIQNLIDR